MAIHQTTIRKGIHTHIYALPTPPSIVIDDNYNDHDTAAWENGRDPGLNATTPRCQETRDPYYPETKGTPFLGADTPTCECAGASGGVGGTVNIFSGEFRMPLKPVTVPSRGFPFEFNMTYRSMAPSATATGLDGLFGARWDYAYNAYLVAYTGGVWRHDGTGRSDFYANLGSTFQSPVGRYDRLEQSGTAYTITDRHGKIETYTQASTLWPYSGTANTYRLTNIQDANGNALRIWPGRAAIDTQNRLYYWDKQGIYEFESLTLNDTAQRMNQYDPAHPYAFVGHYDVHFNWTTGYWNVIDWSGVRFPDPTPSHRSQTWTYDNQERFNGTRVEDEGTPGEDDDGTLDCPPSPPHSCTSIAASCQPHNPPCYWNNDTLDNWPNCTMIPSRNCIPDDNINYTLKVKTLATFTFDNYSRGHRLIEVATDTHQTEISYKYNTTLIESVSGGIANGYDIYGRISSQTYGYGSYSFSYDTRNRVTHVRDRNDNLVDYWYESPERAVITDKVVWTNRHMNPNDPLTFRTTYTYNSQTETTSIHYPRGNSERFIFDDTNPNWLSQGNLLCHIRDPGPFTTDSDGNRQSPLITNYTYEPQFNHVATIEDARGNYPDYKPPNGGDQSHARYTSHYSYLGPNLVSATYPTVNPFGVPNPEFAAQYGNQARSESWTYNSHGQVTSHTDVMGSRETWSYFTGNGQTAVDFHYVMGNTKWYNTPPQPDPVLTDYTYPLAAEDGNDFDPGDGEGYVSQHIQDVDHYHVLTAYTRDDRGNPTSISDGSGATYNLTFNGGCQLTQVTSPAPFKYETQIARDANGRPTQVKRQTDVNGAYTVDNTTYDILGHITSQTKYAKRPADAPWTKQDLHPTTYYCYDRNENRIMERRPGSVNGTQPWDLTSTIYDERDHVISVTRGDILDKYWTQPKSPSGPDCASDGPYCQYEFCAPCRDIVGLTCMACSPLAVNLCTATCNAGPVALCGQTGNPIPGYDCGPAPKPPCGPCELAAGALRNASLDSIGVNSYCGACLSNPLIPSFPVATAGVLNETLIVGVGLVLTAACNPCGPNEMLDSMPADVANARHDLCGPCTNSMHEDWETGLNQTACVVCTASSTCDYCVHSYVEHCFCTPGTGSELPYCGPCNDEDGRTNESYIFPMGCNRRGIIWQAPGNYGFYCGSNWGCGTHGSDSSTTMKNYDENGNLVSERSGRGYTTRYEYDGYDRQTAKVDQMGGRSEKTYDPVSNVVRERFCGYSTPNGALATTKSAPVWRYVVGLQACSKTPLPQGTQLYSETLHASDEANREYRRDALFQDESTGLPLLDGPLTPGDGYVTSLTEYDVAGHTVQSINDNLHATQSIYDTMGRLNRTIDAAGNTVTKHYDAVGNEKGETRIDVNLDAIVPSQTFDSSSGHDSMGRQTQSKDASGAISATAYDGLGNAKSSRDASGALVFHMHDALSRNIEDIYVVSTPTQSSFVTNQTFTVTGDSTTSTVKLRGGTTYTFWGPVQYDTVGENTTIKGGVIGTSGLLNITYDYDADGRLVEMRDGLNQTTRYAYDALGRKISETAPDGTSMLFTYDADDHVVGFYDPNGNTVTTEYDALGRQTHIYAQLGYGVIGTNQQAFAYDATGRLVESWDNDTVHPNGNSHVSRTYDSLGNLLSQTETVGKTPQTSHATYDGLGNRLTFVYPNGRILTETYDVLERPREIKSLISIDPYGINANVFESVAKYSYLGKSREVANTLGNGIVKREKYDSGGLLTSLGYRLGSTTVIGFNYTYDDAHRLTSKAKVHQVSDNEDYTMDALGRLTSFSRPTTSVSTLHQQDWNLDKANNWASTTKTVGATTATETRLHGNTNEVTSISGGTNATLSYDANGNMVDNGEYTFKWDFKNRLREVTHKAVGFTPAVVTGRYWYDTDNHRVRRDEAIISKTTIYFLDGMNEIQESDCAGNVQSQLVMGRGVDEILRVDYPAAAVSTPTIVCDAAPPTITQVDPLTCSPTTAPAGVQCGPCSVWVDSNPTVIDVPTNGKAGSCAPCSAEAHNYVAVPTPPGAPTASSTLGLTCFTCSLQGASNSAAAVTKPLASCASCKNVTFGLSEGVPPGEEASEEANCQPCGPRATGSGSADASAPLPVSGILALRLSCLPCPITSDLILVAQTDPGGSPPPPPTYDPSLACAKPVLKRYILQDEQMSVYAETDEVASVTEGYEYDPYGRALVYMPATVGGTVSFTASDNIHDGDWATFHHLYTGRNYDAESSLLYYRSRYLDLHLGRFISKDTIGVWGDAKNLGSAFAYVSNAPPSRADPSGMGWGLCLTFWDCADARTPHAVHITILKLKGNLPDYSCSDMESDVKNGIGIVATATGLRLDVSTACIADDALGLADAELHDSCKAATAVSGKARGGKNDAAVVFMGRGLRNGCQDGKGVSVSQEADGWDWSNEMIVAHEYSHTQHAIHFAHGENPTTGQMLGSCFNHVQGSYMNYCDAAGGVRGIDSENRKAIRGAFGES